VEQVKVGPQGWHSPLMQLPDLQSVWTEQEVDATCVQSSTQVDTAGLESGMA
jgi:hypothetical protein